MAFPSVVARSTYASTAVNTLSWSVGNTGATAGNLLVAFVAADGNPTLTPSDGWQRLGKGNNSTNVAGAVFFRAATGDANDALTVGVSVGEQLTAIIIEVSGSNLLIDGTHANGSSTTGDPPSHTPWPNVAQDYLWLISRMGDSTVVSASAPTNYANLQTSTAAGTGGASTNTAERQLNASNTNPGGFTTSPGEQWVAWTVAIWEHPGDSTPTLDSANKSPNISLSNGDKTGTKTTSDGDTWARATQPITHGRKVYLEFVCTDVNQYGGNAIMNYNQPFGAGGNAQNTMGVDNSGGDVAGAGSFSLDNVGGIDGTIVGYAIDDVLKKLWIHVNGTWGDGNPATGSGGYNFKTMEAGTYWPCIKLYQNGDVQSLRTLASEFSYSIPSGFSAYEAAPPGGGRTQVLIY